MMFIALISALIFAVGVLVGLWFHAEITTPKKPALPENREDDPQALIDHLKAMDGCSCPPDGIPTLKSYYCLVHGEENRKKYATVESIQAEIDKHRPLNITKAMPLITSQTDKFSPSEYALLAGLENEETDEGRVDLLQNLTPTYITDSYLKRIMEEFETDDGRNSALCLMARNVISPRTAVLEIGEEFETDDGRKTARFYLLQK